MTTPFDIMIDPRGFVLIALSGDVLEGQTATFSDELKKGFEMIRAYSTERKAKIKILVDLGNFSGKYSVEAMELFADFAADDAPYVDRSAIYGLSAEIRAAAKITTAMSGRKNISVFDSREKALKWLGIEP
ncbi:MAG: STAS/SEC14 domain-containing protein [Patescibacteria group bacterium]|nr:STAS/SEC14 domain-containing protein [Patescibacteria group bacterium]